MLRPDAIVIAGDVYDKSVPSAEAVGIFDCFLTELSALKPEIPILIISGNHDSAQRLDYASGILGQKGIYIAGKLPQNREEFLKKSHTSGRIRRGGFLSSPVSEAGICKDRV